MELKIIEKKNTHFLTEWNKITVYDTNRLLLVMFLSAFVPLPMLVYIPVLFCILVYFVFYNVSRNYNSIGIIRIDDNTIFIRTISENKEIYFDSLEKFILTYKTWTKRIINKNKQTDFNWIYIKTNDFSIKLNYVFTDNSNFHDCLELLEKKQKENNAINFFNLAKMEIDDLVKLN